MEKGWKRCWTSNRSEALREEHGASPWERRALPPPTLKTPPNTPLSPTHMCARAQMERQWMQKTGSSPLREAQGHLGTGGGGHRGRARDVIDR